MLRELNEDIRRDSAGAIKISDSRSASQRLDFNSKNLSSEAFDWSASNMGDVVADPMSQAISMWVSFGLMRSEA